MKSIGLGDKKKGQQEQGWPDYQAFVLGTYIVGSIGVRELHIDRWVKVVSAPPVEHDYPPLPTDNPPVDLHFCDSVPVLCLVCFCFFRLSCL